MTFTIDQIQHACFNGTPGYCSACEYYDEHASVEPDAREYTCPDCGESTFYGLEWAFMAGMLQIKG
jgi:predicted RNA-binding Zn-ribbon protein involved in translation (DUF1610 family)